MHAALIAAFLGLWMAGADTSEVARRNRARHTGAFQGGLRAAQGARR